MHLLSCTGPKIRASLKGDRGTSGFWRFGTGICDGASATEPSMDHNCRNSVFFFFLCFSKKYQYQSQIMQESHMGAVRVRLSFRKTHCKRRLVHIQVLDKKNSMERQAAFWYSLRWSYLERFTKTVHQMSTGQVPFFKKNTYCKYPQNNP